MMGPLLMSPSENSEARVRYARYISSRSALQSQKCQLRINMTAERVRGRCGHGVGVVERQEAEAMMRTHEQHVLSSIYLTVVHASHSAPVLAVLLDGHVAREVQAEQPRSVLCRGLLDLLAFRSILQQTVHLSRTSIQVAELLKITILQ